MEKIAIITDSMSDLTKEKISEYNIKVLPLKIIYKDREYTDGIDITPDYVYSNLKNEIPTTSMPSVGDVTLLYEDLIAKGYTHVIGITVSSGLSGTFNNFNLVANDYSDKITSFILDSLCISKAEGFLVETAYRLLNEGKSFDEICSTLPKYRDKIRCFFTPSTLEYLIKGGRIGRAAGAIGEVLKLKPILSIDENGKYYSVSKVRGDKQAFSRLVSTAEEFILKGKCTVKVMHGGGLEKGTKLFEAIKALDNGNIQSIEFGDLNAVAGVHAGPEFIAFAVMPEID